jgi:NAD(P)-dependent dehydrogenase (short-subunit alcohol dehydrogenase family)
MMQDKWSLQESTAVVTGAGAGIGQAIAVGLAAAGAKVACADINGGAAEETARSIEADGGHAIGVATDVASEVAVDALFAKVEARFGLADILVNNAGIMDPPVHFLDETLENWNRILEVNLGGCFLCSHRAALSMVELGRGAIINTSSGGATRAHRAKPSYDASKGGIEGFSRAIALDLAPYGIRVNVLVPGSIDTSRGAMSTEMVASRSKTIPVGRLGTPADLVGSAVFLASSQSEYVTGTTVVVDGGLLAQQRSPEVDLFRVEDFPRKGRLAGT